MPDEDKPAAEKPARRAPAKRKAEGEICKVHWPSGWPEGAGNTASCEHGNYTR